MFSRTLVAGLIFGICFSVSATGLSLSSRIKRIPISELSALSYSVTQLGGTEKPYDNPYWDNHEEGIYVDIIDSTPLFSSLDKYDSGTGWPTFARPINSHNISQQPDTSGGAMRTEIKSKRSNSHLGHLFDDGPAKYNGVRYCMNSAALRFVPLANMKSEGYVSYLRIWITK